MKDLRQASSAPLTTGQSKDLDSLKLTENEKARIGGTFQREENKKFGLIRLIEMTSQAQIDKIKDNRQKREEIRIRIIDYVMADGDTNKFIEWLEEKLLV